MRGRLPVYGRLSARDIWARQTVRHYYAARGARGMCSGAYWALFPSCRTFVLVGRRLTPCTEGCARCTCHSSVVMCLLRLRRLRADQVLPPLSVLLCG